MSGPAHREESLPAGYGQLLEELKSEVVRARWRAQRVVNTELLRLYWQMGHLILTRQSEQGWGTRVIARLAADFQPAFPQMRGLSRSNLFYMRGLAAAWPAEAIVQQPVDDYPGGTSRCCWTGSTTGRAGLVRRGGQCCRC